MITYANFADPLKCKGCHEPLTEGARDSKYRIFARCCALPPMMTNQRSRHFAWLEEAEARALEVTTAGKLGVDTELKFINTYAEL